MKEFIDVAKKHPLPFEELLAAIHCSKNWDEFQSTIKDATNLIKKFDHISTFEALAVSIFDKTTNYKKAYLLTRLYLCRGWKTNLKG